MGVLYYGLVFWLAGAGVSSSALDRGEDMEMDLQAIPSRWDSCYSMLLYIWGHNTHLLSFQVPTDGPGGYFVVKSRRWRRVAGKKNKDKS